MSCTLQEYTHIALNVTRIVENKHPLFLPTLRSTCGALCTNKEVHVTFECIEAFISLLGVSDNVRRGHVRDMSNDVKIKQSLG